MSYEDLNLSFSFTFYRDESVYFLLFSNDCGFGVMEVYVGTSGWMYAWNEEQSLDWYVKNSRLNAVELNASFYRFHFPNWVKSWQLKGKGLRWSIKVNRLITHTFKFDGKSLVLWKRFEDTFKPLESNIDFYLFQLPPFMKPNFAPRLQKFVEKTHLGQKFALEVRHTEWFNKTWTEWATKLGITWVSVDCPDYPLDVFNTSGMVYERMHGRYEWYSTYYKDEELEEVAKEIAKVKPKKAYVFFNNDHAMLDNSRKMLVILNRLK